MKPKTLPSQDLLDAVAHFHEAAVELSSSPLFDRNADSLRISWVGDFDANKAKVTLPDELWIKASLLPFRKMWLTSDCTCHSAIVRKINVCDPWYVEMLDGLKPRNFEGILGALGIKFDTILTPDGLVDLYLNTRYMHSGGDKTKRYSRNKFDEFERQFGQAVLKYAFLLTVKFYGIYFSNIDRFCCKPFLADCAEQGMQPSIRLRLPDELDPNIIQSSKGSAFYSANTQKALSRLLDQHQNDHLKSVFTIYEFRFSDLVDIFISQNTFDAALAELGIEARKADNLISMAGNDILMQEFFALPYGPRSHCNGFKEGHVVFLRGRKMLWNKEYMDIMRELYLNVRDALIVAAD
jgi:hypothetical protein